MGKHFCGQEQSVQDIMEARDVRVRYHDYLLRGYKRTVISYKLNIPGPVKYSPLIKQIFDVGLSELNRKLDQAFVDIVHEKVWYKKSGPEYFAVVDVAAIPIKKLSTSIEEKHPLGRLFDFDIINSDGSQVSREKLGIGQRKCLLCKKGAFECGRSRRHDVDTLITHIRAMAFNYFRLYEEVI
ncbi:citrate lyase holo-[acyl-carrier protein] synthase [Clostridium sp. YIM B02515]|uniref:citrate lyase holo-[acyl-carrier protein] synthase n=1 Tax=Clostridium rhizosphaerae TaxID=2803861 RepID=A0ABS1THX3_9CLOT|nr:citrate lyase holo-[acyl-carrier protein] synthase [Clostridium rhizosphaerae]